MRFIPVLVFLMACNPLMWKAAEDVVVGEVRVVEDAVKDLSGVQPQSRPVIVPIKKF
jgi:hypothetical protein